VTWRLGNTCHDGFCLVIDGAARPLTPLGGTAVAWRLDDRLLYVNVSLPPGVSGVLSAPGAAKIEVSPWAVRYEFPPGGEG
jgi:hypothetical protein